MSSRIDELTGRTGRSKSASRIEELTGRSGSKTKSRVEELTGAGSASQQAQSLPVLEAEAAAVGAPAPAQDSPGLFRRAIDLISRPNYAVAGAAEEAFSPQGGGIGAIPGRVINELFSGVGGLKGQKEGFAQVMEDAGVGPGGSFSDLVSGLYNETGEGWQFQKGGILDPTARGAGGLALDIFGDPTTYLGFGVAGKTAKVGEKFLSKTGQRLYVSEVAKAMDLIRTPSMAAKEAAGGLLTQAERSFVRDSAQVAAKARVAAAIEAGATNLLDRGGIKWAGMHIADNPLKAIAESGVAKELAAKLGATPAGQFALAASAWRKRWITDPIGGLFSKGYGIRGLEGAQGIIDDSLNKSAFRVGLANKAIADSPLGKWANVSAKERERIFQPVIDAYEAGGLAAVPEEFRAAMTFLAKSKAEMHANEVAAGLLTTQQKIINYFAHYYKNDPEDIERVLFKHKGETAQGTAERMLRMGRNAEERAYPTLRDASETSARLNRADKSIPVLEPIYDPIEVLRRRWEHSITKRTNLEMVSELEAKFGQLPFKVDEVYSLANAAEKLAPADAKAFREAAFGAPGDKVTAVARLSDQGKRLFFKERFRQIADRAEAQNVLSKYDQFREFFPKQVAADGSFAADGSVFKVLEAHGKEWMLPKTLRDEVASMDNRVIKDKNLRALLQGFDTANNVWKGSVTWLFPAFHVRNAYSNVAQSFVDIGAHALNPSSYYETAKILFTKQPGTFKTAIGEYTYDEVRQILNRNGVNTSAAALAEFTGNESKLLKPFAGARNVGTAIENESRAQLALNYLRRGMDPAEVGARVKKFELDYANGLTSFERAWMKRVIPFYTFQKLNLRLMIDNLAKRPGMTLTELKPFLGRDSENQQMTSWDAGALKLRLNRDGKTVQMLTGVDLPIRNLDLLFRGTLKDTFANAVGMLTPFLKVPIEVGANKSFFTGNEFDRKNAHTAGVIIEKMPESMQRWMGYKKEFDKAGRAQYTFDAQRYYLVAESFVASRFLSTSDRQWRQYLSQANGTSLQSLLDITTGLRYVNMDMDEEMKKKKAERTRDLERALVRWGQRKEFRRVYKPKGQP